jgi:hypothetical protein
MSYVITVIEHELIIGEALLVLLKLVVMWLLSVCSIFIASTSKPLSLRLGGG